MLIDGSHHLKNSQVERKEENGGFNVPVLDVPKLQTDSDENNKIVPGPTIYEDTTNRPCKWMNMANFFKACSWDVDKYSSVTADNFEHNFMQFLESSQRANIPDEDQHHAFSVILIDHALHHYFNVLKPKNLTLK